MAYALELLGLQAAAAALTSQVGTPMKPPKTSDTALPCAFVRARVTRTALPVDSAAPVRTSPVRGGEFQLTIRTARPGAMTTDCPSTLFRTATSAAALRAAAGPPLANPWAAARAA